MLLPKKKEIFNPVASPHCHHHLPYTFAVLANGTVQIAPEELHALFQRLQTDTALEAAVVPEQVERSLELLTGNNFVVAVGAQLVRRLGQHTLEEGALWAERCWGE